MTKCRNLWQFGLFVAPNKRNKWNKRFYLRERINSKPYSSGHLFGLGNMGFLCYINSFVGIRKRINLTPSLWFCVYSSHLSRLKLSMAFVNCLAVSNNVIHLSHFILCSIEMMLLMQRWRSQSVYPMWTCFQHQKSTRKKTTIWHVQG